MYATLGTTTQPSGRTTQPVSDMRPASPSEPESDQSRVRVDPFVRWLALDPVLAASKRPIHVIVEKLALVLDVECVVVGELLDVVPETVRTVAWWKDGRHPDNVEFPVAGSPCEPVVGGRPSYCPIGVTRRYVQVGFQKAEGIEAYAAHPLTSSDGVRRGLISVMSRQRFKDGRRVRRLLAACAPRLAGKIERLHRDRKAAPPAPFVAMLQRVQALLLDEDAWAGTGLAPAGTVGLHVTPREKEIIRGLVCYRRLATVADVLGISVHTARNHLKSVFRKLNLHSQDELLQFLLEGDA